FHPLCAFIDHGEQETGEAATLAAAVLTQLSRAYHRSRKKILLRTDIAGGSPSVCGCSCSGLLFGWSGSDEDGCCARTVPGSGSSY
ncbi:MAG TPA: hypothetical protein H9836_10895, partial [Candidatus Nocardiopsis merdipullorum]|nr:hypothetical protein [Candidatus Nocardiopsis merdipullorum]